MAVATLFTDPGTASHAGAGSAHVISGGVDVFSSDQSGGWVGRDAKNEKEVNLFLRFDVEAAIPRGSRINRAALKLTANFAAIGPGGFRLGSLQPAFDGKPVRNGWTYNIINPPPPPPDAFQHAFDFFPGQGAPAHPTFDSSAVILGGRLLFDAFEAGPFAWLGILADQQFFIGNSGFDLFSTTKVQLVTAARLNLNGEEVHLWVLDSDNVSNADNKMPLYLDPITPDSRKPTLQIDYDLNPPEITSTAPTTGEELAPYTYSPTFTVYSLGDQTGGAFVTPNTWEIIGAPTGLTVNPATGVVDWTPSLGQSGFYAFRLRVTNPSLLTDDEIIQITVSALGRAATGEVSYRHSVAYIEVGVEGDEE